MLAHSRLFAFWVPTMLVCKEEAGLTPNRNKLSLMFNQHKMAAASAQVHLSESGDSLCAQEYSAVHGENSVFGTQRAFL